MRLTAAFRRLVVILAFIIVCINSYAQNCFNTGLNNSTFNLACGVTCYNRPIQVPDIRSTDNYVVSQVAYLPFPTHAGTVVTTSNRDDVYSDIIDLPFRFCFFDSVYEKIVVGSNGIVTFDERRAGEVNAYKVQRSIPYDGGVANNQESIYYPPACIMGVFQDLDPTKNAANRRIEYATYGVAPCRKFVISFYEMAFFTGDRCAGLTNTTQIVLFESTGIIEVQVGNKESCFAQDEGRAILGIQNWDRTIGITPPGKNAANWTESNTAYRFTPGGGSSRFISSEAFLLDGTPLGAATSANTTPGLVDLTFPGLCPTVSGTQYIIRNTFSSCDDPSVNLTNSDTITINLTSSLQATAVTTASDCGVAGTGQIAVTVPAGIGTGPYSYVLDGGTPVPGGNTYTFSGVTAGAHTVIVSDAGGCSSNLAVNVPNTGVLAATVNTTAATCTGAYNGTITVNVPNGDATTEYNMSTNPAVWQSSNVFTGLNPGFYFIQVRHGTCVSGIITALVGGSGTTVTGTVATAATTCAGVNNGSITVTPTSGAGTYEYAIDGGAWQSSNIFNGLAPATYNIRIRQNGVCISANIPAVVTAGGGIQATITQTPTACTGVSTGTVTVTPTNGVGPYTYTIDGGAPQTFAGAHTFSGLGAGSHIVSITDDIGCVTTTPLTINVTTASGFTATAAATATACPGVSSGSITITPGATAVAPFSYVLDGGTAQVSPTFTGVAAGTHSVLVTDGNGCSFTVTNITVAAGTGIQATLTQTPTACTGVSTGTITVTPTNGVGPYTYSIDGGGPQTFAGANTFTGLGAGNHTVTITDNIGCVTTAPLAITVTTAAGFTATAAATPTACPGVNNGSITVTPSAAAMAPLTYILDGGTAQAAAIFNNVSAGVHSVLVTDGNGCQYTVNNITVGEGTGLRATVTTVPGSCNVATNGSITVVPANGTAPFSYSLDGGTAQPGATFNNVSPGIHIITITDDLGCTGTLNNINVAAGPALTTTSVQQAASCNGGNNGSIVVAVPTMGTAPYSYSLDGVNWQAGNTFTGLTANNYTVYYREQNGCQGQHNVTITEPAALAITTKVTAATCNGNNDGTIRVTATGGNGGYRYSLDNTSWQASNLFNLPANTYNVYVEDATGCRASVTNVVVAEPAALTAVINNITDATCEGGDNGAITIAASGGTAPYRYGFENGNPGNNATIHNGPGTYNIVVSDANNCSYTISGVVIGLNNNLSFTPMVDPAAICEGTGTQLAIVSNATGYAWTGAGLSNNSIANPMASPRQTTTYTVQLTLGRCTATDDVVVPVNAAPVPNAGPDGDICYGQDYRLNGSGGTVYNWSPVTYLADATQATTIAQRPAQTITYTLSVKDANGCSSLITDAVTVKVTPPLKVIATPKDTVVYEGSIVPLRAITLSQQTNQPIPESDLSYSWTPATGLNNAGIAAPLATAGSTGSISIYTVTARSAGGCEGETTATIRVYKGPELYTPNAFTPNGDGHNDKFFPFPVGIDKLNYFRVLNRWGQVIFSTTTLHDGWDGRFKGIEQDNGAYIWMAEGITTDGQKITKKGTVMLIR
ncbi:gliding motility-associated C-terminal domain-containing protein [Terrimonas rubra]|uniref:Gliding motility-associated C-terminal domain-containing protein n=1 Tax=Terrimonas rubra TaxID=1035890 RepID=A0ABW6A5T8_9BACT